jgi:dTDP-4-dehydrorhamnose 3,5-epimerase-like enzyme
MKVTPLAIPDVLLIEPRVFEDERGYPRRQESCRLDF